MTCDVSTITDPAALLDLITAASERHAQLQAEQATDDAERKARIAAADATLVALLGPDNATAGQGSIRAMLRYSDTDLQNHAGLALRLVLTGMEIQTRTMLDIVRVVGQAE